jgi:hypothetical protein
MGKVFLTTTSLSIERWRLLREFMEVDGQMRGYQCFIAPASGSVRFAKALDRTVTGSINELVKYATSYLETGEISPYDVGFKLNVVRLSALVEGKRDYGKPKEAF